VGGGVTEPPRGPLLPATAKLQHPEKFKLLDKSGFELPDSRGFELTDTDTEEDTTKKILPPGQPLFINCI